MTKIPRYEDLVNKVKKAVCEEYGLELEAMSAKSGRKKDFVEPRHIAIHLCRKHLAIGYKELAEAFDMSDHTSAMHAYNTMSWSNERDKRISKTIIKIESAMLPELSSHKRVVYYTFFDGRVCHGLYKDEQSVVKQPIGNVMPIIVHR